MKAKLKANLALLVFIVPAALGVFVAIYGPHKAAAATGDLLIPLIVIAGLAFLAYRFVR